jgi:predicted PurR-regulated permease PerM
VVVLAIIISLGLLLWWRGTAITEQAGELTDRLTHQAQRLWTELDATGWGTLIARSVRDQSLSARGILTGYVPGDASSVLGIGGSVVIVAATAVFLAISPQLYVNGGLRLLPVRWRPRGRVVVDQIGRTLQLWFLGQLADMLIVTIVIGMGLFLLGVPLATSLALFAGLLNFVPYFGALAGAVPAMLVALSQSPSLAAWVAIFFLAVQTIEGNVTVPLIQKRTVSLPPALTILSQTILGTLFGVFGLVVATPLVAALLTAVRMVYIEGILEGGHGAASDDRLDRPPLVIANP